MTDEGIEDAARDLVWAVRVLEREGMVQRDPSLRDEAYVLLYQWAQAKSNVEERLVPWFEGVSAVLLKWFEKGIPAPDLKNGEASVISLLNTSVRNLQNSGRRGIAKVTVFLDDELPDHKLAASEGDGDGPPISEAEALARMGRALEPLLQRFFTEIVEPWLALRRSGAGKARLAIETRIAMARGQVKQRDEAAAALKAEGIEVTAAAIETRMDSQRKSQNRSLTALRAHMIDPLRMDPDECPEVRLVDHLLSVRSAPSEGPKE